MDQESLKKTIAGNMLIYRKRAGLTQAELAEKINYSDKAVSKWERGDGMPDVAVLCEMAEIFGVTLNDMVSEKAPAKLPPVRGMRIIITCLSLAIVWLVATLVSTVLTIAAPWFRYGWMAYIYGIPISFVVLTVFTAVWKHTLFLFISVSGLIWTVILAIYLSLWFIPNIALLFVLGAPLEFMAVLWFFRPFAKKRG
jgi:transcriptional regulator, XRE family